MLLWREGSTSINDAKNRIYCNLASDGICGSHTSCNNMLSKLKRILLHWLLQKSRRKIMKQLLQANFFEENLFASCSMPQQGLKKKKPWHESETGCEYILPVCLRWDDFLQLITDESGEVEKQISTAVFSLLWGSIIWQVQKHHIQLRFSYSSANPLLHLFSNSPRSRILQQPPTDHFVHNPTSQCSSGVAPSPIDELVVFSSSWQSAASAPWPLARGCL